METNTMQSSVTSGSSEIVYGNSSIAGSDESRVMSEKVQTLASSIYRQFEAMIKKHGEESVKDLMPLVVNVLESLDLAYLEKEEHLVDLEMLKEDNEQLITQYEREKQLRKAQDQKCLELEESASEQTRELEGKIQSLESIVRMLELRAKNATDHATRLEERENIQKEEYDKLHQRYNDLLRTHIEHVERTKYLMGADKFDMMQSLPKSRMSSMATSVDANVRGISDLISAVHMSQSTHADVNLANHISNERDWQEEFGQSADIIQSPREDDQISREDVKSVREEADDLLEKDKEPEDSLSADLTGMGREVENLIKENNELLETKNALNIVKNDLIARVDELSSESQILRAEVESLEMVKNKMSDRIRELEIELREIKEKVNAEDVEPEDDIPMAQRKRFTRVEMARVLMERNQYKEKLMELEDAVKYTEMQRAKRMNSNPPQSRSRIWDFFSELIGGPQAPAGHQPVRRTGKRPNDAALRRKAHARNYDLDLESVQEKRMAERRQQYRAVSQHMKKEDDSRTHAYGWSIPVTVDTASSSASIPVPVCCRPLLDRQPSLKIWCASGVALHGGRTKDGGYIVGDSVFYADFSNTSNDDSAPSDANRVDLLDYELRIQQREKLEQEFSIWECSSLVWVCSSNERRSFVTILDANNPNNIIECFNVGEAHLLSVASVAGVRESDYPHDETPIAEKYNRQGGYVKDLPADAGEHEAFGAVSWIELRRSDIDDIPTYCSIDEKSSPRRERNFSVSETNPEVSEKSDEIAPEKLLKPDESEINANELHSPRTTLNLEKRVTFATPEETIEEKEERTLRSWSNLQPHIRDGLSKYEGIGEITTALPTMWMGLENDYIYIHSGVSEWRKCLRRIKMPDAVLHILHYKGRVFAALANGALAVFVRDADGNWSDAGYLLIRLGKPTSSVCHLIVVAGRIWAAYRNCVVVIDPKQLIVESSFVAHPRRDSQVRNMVWVGDGVWLSIRLDSTIRLYHAHTYQHLQDVDIEPYITKMLGSNKLDFLHLRITSLLVLNRRLWIGTGTGVIVSVPLSEENNTKVEVSKVDSKKGSSEEVRGPGGLIRVYGNPNSDRVSPGSFIPYCNMTHAQLSFHGHKDAVRFFLPVPADSNPALLAEMDTRKILMVSGGDGYIDFRLGEEDDPPPTAADQVRIHDMSHLIVWELEVPNLSKRLT